MRALFLIEYVKLEKMFIFLLTKKLGRIPEYKGLRLSIFIASVPLNQTYYTRN